MLFWLASYPRSGNAYFRSIVSERYGLWCRDQRFPPRFTDPHAERMQNLEQCAAIPEPVLVKTHELPGSDTFAAIYLLRDGRDSLVSYTHFALTIENPVPPEKRTPQLFRSTLHNLLVEERSAYGTWSENVLSWTRRAGVVVVRYEDLVRDPGGVADRALAAANIPCTRVSDAVPTFERMKKERPQHVRRGQTGSWRDEFPPDLLPLFWKRNGEVMRRFGYTDGELRATA